MATATTASDDGPRAKIGIISLGDMGSGLARLLTAKGYSVVTNCAGRSQDTIDRAQAVGAELLPTDVALVDACDVILSVVPPKEAVATAERIVAALSATKLLQRTSPLYLADMNAVSPASVRNIAALFASSSSSSVYFIDGSILGGPPSLPEDGDPTAPVSEWYRPLLPTSGPHSLASIPGYGAHLAATLQIKHIGPEIGAASGLKMCFASLSKGYAAIAVQAVTTARRLGVLDDLRDALQTVMPANLARMDKAVVGMAPKAYRWVREMEEISATHADEGGFQPELIFSGAARVFQTVAEDTVLGEEKVGRRKRGTTAEAIADAMVEGIERKRKKTE
ncbi:6-phosphogluconate dehydrogenase [Podospora didyma]|uniref:6-phosphogluconate dehydrogenase n=1 Tax=Podospora didyma TaxID=330526 RepID=A0AAE0P7E5_9PEZI|nr:6-phosphogluconate dehydrogenase [Podospora didyma]